MHKTVYTAQIQTGATEPQPATGEINVQATHAPTFARVPNVDSRRAPIRVKRQVTRKI